MKNENFIKGIKMLEIAFDKKLDDMTINLYKQAIETEDRYFILACERIVKQSSFFPKISNIISTIHNIKVEEKKSILIFMKDKGYFKNIREYDKAVMWASSELDQIPGWLKEDMIKYKKMQENENLLKLGQEPKYQIEQKTPLPEGEDILGDFFNGK